MVAQEDVDLTAVQRGGVLQMKEETVYVAFAMAAIELVADLNEDGFASGPFAVGVDDLCGLEGGAEGVHIAVDVANSDDAVCGGVTLGGRFLGFRKV